MSGWRRGQAYPQDLRDRVLSANGMGCGEVTTDLVSVPPMW